MEERTFSLKKLWFGIGIVILLIVIALYSKPTQKVVTKLDDLAPQVQLEAAKRTISSSFQEANSTKIEVISVSQLPKELAGLVATSSSSISIEKKSYDNNSTGYSLNYSVNMPLQETYFGLLSRTTKERRDVKSVYSLSAAVADFTLLNYSVYAEFTASGEGRTLVSIIIIENQ